MSPTSPIKSPELPSKRDLLIQLLRSAKEVCLTDELGFLFHMLVSSRGQCCQATNFLRAFSQLPEASRLELLDKTTATAFVPREGSDQELLRRVQNLNRFVLEQMHKEMSGKDREAAGGGGKQLGPEGAAQQSAIDLVFGSDMRRIQTVSLAGAGGGAQEDGGPGSQQVSREFQWRLTYPKHPPAADAAAAALPAARAEGSGADVGESKSAGAASLLTFEQVNPKP